MLKHLKKAQDHLENATYDGIMKTSQKLPYSKKIKASIKEYLHKLTDYEIAMGFAIGVFWGVFPTFGLGLIPAVITAYFLKASKIISFFGTWVANPLTFPLFFTLEVLITKSIIGVEVTEKYLMSLVTTWEFGSVIWAFILSCVIISFVFAALAYFLARFVLRKYRERQNSLISNI